MRNEGPAEPGHAAICCNGIDLPGREVAVVADKREVLSQLLIVASLLGAFSMSGAIALLVGHNRDRLHRLLFGLLAGASLAFILATTLDAIILPAAGMVVQRQRPQEVSALLQLGDVVIWGVIAGALALLLALGCSGFTFSRGLGLLLASAAGLTLALFAICARHLAVSVP